MLKWGYAVLRKLRKNGFSGRKHELRIRGKLAQPCRFLPEDTEVYPGHGVRPRISVMKRDTIHIVKNKNQNVHDWMHLIRENLNMILIRCQSLLPGGRNCSVLYEEEDGVNDSGSAFRWKITSRVL